MIKLFQDRPVLMRFGIVVFALTVLCLRKLPIAAEWQSDNNWLGLFQSGPVLVLCASALEFAVLTLIAGSLVDQSYFGLRHGIRLFGESVFASILLLVILSSFYVLALDGSLHDDIFAGWTIPLLVALFTFVYFLCLASGRREKPL